MKIKELLDRLDYERSQLDTTYTCHTCCEDIEALDRFVAQSIRDGELEPTDWYSLAETMFDYILELHGLGKAVERAIPLTDIFPETDNAVDECDYDPDGDDDTEEGM